MISVIASNKGMAIEIDCDDAGIDLLIEVLTALRGSGSHRHLRASGAGGCELSDKTPFGAEAIPELIISHGGD